MVTLPKYVKTKMPCTMIEKIHMAQQQMYFSKKGHDNCTLEVTATVKTDYMQEKREIFKDIIYTSIEEPLDEDLSDHFMSCVP